MSEAMVFFLGNLFFLASDVVLIIFTLFNRVMVIRCGIIAAKLIMISTIIFLIGIDKPAMMSFFLSSIFMIVLNILRIIQYYYQNNITAIPPHLLDIYCEKFSILSPYEFMYLVTKSEKMSITGEITEHGKGIDNVYVILEGKIQLKVQNIVTHLYGPLIVGDVAYLDTKAHRAFADVRTSEVVPVLIISPQVIESVKKKFPGFQQRLSHVFAKSQTEKLNLVSEEFRRYSYLLPAKIMEQHVLLYRQLFSKLGPYEFKSLMNCAIRREVTNQPMRFEKSCPSLLVLSEGAINLQFDGHEEITMQHPSILSEIVYLSAGKDGYGMSCWSKTHAVVLEFTDEKLAQLETQFSGFLNRLHASIAMNVARKMLK